jgi:hypothetical protein
MYYPWGGGRGDGIDKRQISKIYSEDATRKIKNKTSLCWLVRTHQLEMDSGQDPDNKELVLQRPRDHIQYCRHLDRIILC